MEDEIEQRYLESEKLLFREYCDVKDLQDRSTACQMMEFYMKELNIDISGLNVVHVTGSKGKGSTCFYVEAALRKYGYSTGLYTSPHIQSLCERFRINGEPISKKDYLRHFDVVWSKLQEIKQRPDSERPSYITRWPGFFRFLTLIAFRIFIESKVDVVILEVGMGGRLDATNVVQHPVTTGVTLIDLEHTEVLGNTLEKIAYEKGGIFKKNAPAVVLNQSEEVIQSLVACAEKEGCPIQVVSPEDRLQQILPDVSDASSHAVPHFLLQNFAVASTLVSNVLESFGASSKWSADVMRDVLLNTHVSARAQTISFHNHTCFIDGAHTPRSIKEACEWFLQQSHGLPCGVLFYCGRDKHVSELVRQLCRLEVKEVVICGVKHPKPEYTHVEVEAIESMAGKQGMERKQMEALFDGIEKMDGDAWLKYVAKVWRIEEFAAHKAMSSLRIAKNVEDAWNDALPHTVCITGSLYLCGDFLNMIGYHFPVC